jgi:alcohol dehydrogenase (cytochrome c)
VVAKAEAGYAMTHAPLVVKDKVIVGTAGGEYGIRRFLAAFNATTGREVGDSILLPDRAIQIKRHGPAILGRPVGDQSG